MARRCAVTGKGVMTGNKVSHANNKTKREFLPNLQEISFHSDALNKRVKMRITTAGIRTIEHKGGIDAFLAEACSCDLTPALRRAQKLVKAKLAEQAA
jgi:large subunit ribosomal protein L28